MACKKPTRAYQRATGGPLRFTAPDPGQDPYKYRALDVPCGTCELCREEQARQQAVRIYHEALTHELSSFVTLTYSDKHLPEYGSLYYPHLINFIKRARKHYGQFRHFACGEYGDKSLRPHYHLAVFGQAFLSHRVIIREKPTLLWTSPELERLWGLGNVSVGALTWETASYTASYILKKLRSKQQFVRIDESTGELVPVAQPRSFKSDNLGKAWWDQWGHTLTARDYVVINGRRQKPPKAYDKWLAAKDEATSKQIKEQRIKLAKQLTPSEAHARARNAHARAKRRKKSV